MKTEWLMEHGPFCDFGLITAPLAGLIASGIGDIGLGSVLGGALPAISTGIAGAAEGAALGTGLGAIEGKPLGPSALAGGVTGGAISGLGPVVGSALGGGTAATIGGDILAGAGGGALGSAITGQSPLSGALTGSAAGGVAGLGGVGTPSTPSTASPSLTPSSTFGASPATSASAVGTPATAAPTTLGPSTLPAGVPASINTLTDAGAAPAGGLTAASAPGATAGGGGINADVPTGNFDAFGTAAGAGGAGSFLDKALASVEANPPGLVAGGGLLLDTMLQKPISQSPEAQPLQASAAQTGALGSNLESYLASGTLPPGASTAVSNATQAAKANIRSSFGAMGLSGSSMEAEALSAQDRNAAAQTFEIGDQLLAQGAQFTNISDQLYQNILNETLQQDQAFQQALGVFASGLAGAGSRAAATV